MNDVITLRLSTLLLLCLHSAAGEAIGYYDDERQATGSPSVEEAEALVATLTPVIQSPSEPYFWTIPQAWLPRVRNIIPACLAVHDEDELQIRTMKRRVDFVAAQAELLAALAPYDT